MIHQKNTQLGPTPALILYQDRLTQAAENGVILFFHGFTVSKEIQMKELTSLAEHGFLAIGLDMIGHGERRYPDFEARFANDNPEQGINISRLIRETAQEVPLILDNLATQGLIHEQKIGIGGISMGGYVTYKAITLEPRLNVAACIVASPRWLFDVPVSPEYHLDKFAQIKLLSQNASLDETVPAKYARKFHRQLELRYDDYARRLAYFEYPHSGHMMLETDWAICWERTVKWFSHHFAHQNQRIVW